MEKMLLEEYNFMKSMKAKIKESDFQVILVAFFKLLHCL